MTEQQNWRVTTDAQTYFGGQKKQASISDRRPVIRKASDLVGPGIAAQAVPITDFNDLLATYNGMFSAVIGSFGAPNDDEAFVGMTVADGELGGFQIFTGMGNPDSGLGHTYRRRFTRNPSDHESIYWESWVNETKSDIEVGLIMAWPKATPPDGWLVLNGATFNPVTYPALYAFLSTATLPDMRGRTIYGVGGDWTLGQVDGFSDGSRNADHSHSVSTNNAGNHSHSVVTELVPGHTHTIAQANMPVAFDTQGGGGATRLTGGSLHDHGGETGPSSFHNHAGVAVADGAHSHSGSTNTSTKRLPGIGLNWVIRAK